MRLLCFRESLSWTVIFRLGICFSVCILILPVISNLITEKDDKFRLIGSSDRYGSTINLGRIISCEKCQDSIKGKLTKKTERQRRVVFELVDQRKTLERVLLHFAHYEKEAEKLDEKHYRITVVYDKEDETEMVIRILSFGPMLKVTAPQHFVELIKQRLIHQRSCGL